MPLDDQMLFDPVQGHFGVLAGNNESCVAVASHDCHVDASAYGLLDLIKNLILLGLLGEAQYQLRGPPAFLPVNTDASIRIQKPSYVFPTKHWLRLFLSVFDHSLQVSPVDFVLDGLGLVFRVLAEFDLLVLGVDLGPGPPLTLLLPCSGWSRAPLGRWDDEAVR